MLRLGIQIGMVHFSIIWQGSPDIAPSQLEGTLTTIITMAHFGSFFWFQGKLATSGMSVTTLEESDNSPYSNAFEITGNGSIL